MKFSIALFLLSISFCLKANESVEKTDKLFHLEHVSSSNLDKPSVVDDLFCLFLLENNEDEFENKQKFFESIVSVQKLDLACQVFKHTRFQAVIIKKPSFHNKISLFLFYSKILR